AHYDHLGKKDSLIFNGADDNASGTAAIMEIAQAFMIAKKEGKGPRRSVLIIAFSGEEKGLLGSKYYTNKPVFPLEKTIANLNIDMIGRLDEFHKEDSNYVYLIGADRLSQELHDISEQVNEKHIKLELDYRYNKEDDPNRYYYRSDHYNFAKNNIPVIFYFNGVHEDYHKATDTLEKIDYYKIERITKLIFLTAWELANKEERIKLK
ncbi:MAG: peptidase M28, partial [Flavobacteriales bacterium]|nr:peptidase M28 [Flavobacteriales bacterium]